MVIMREGNISKERWGLRKLCLQSLGSNFGLIGTGVKNLYDY
jgi:hypothetical protein